MFNVTRRQAFAASGGLLGNVACASALCQCGRRQHAQHRLQRQPAVLRPGRRAVVGQSDHPGDLPLGLRSIYRPEAQSRVRARPAHRLGLERRQDQGLDGRAGERRLARRQPVHARRRRVVDPARGQAGRRQSGVVHLGRHRQLQDRRQAHHRRREAIRSGPLQVDGVPHRLRAAQGLLRKGRPAGLREEADRHRPVHGRCL